MTADLWRSVSIWPHHYVHLAPIADTIEHELLDPCPCGPEIEWVRLQIADADGLRLGRLFVHHAADGRQAPE